MLKGRFIFELSPNQVLVAEGPWTPSTSGSEWEFAILPFKPLYTDSPRFLNAKRVRIFRREELSHSTIPKLTQPLDWETLPKSQFLSSFQSLKKLIMSGSTHKGVPWSAQRVSYANARHLWEGLLSRIHSVDAKLAIYGAELESESVIGATPEWLFKIEQGGMELTTMALAGTRWMGQIRDEEQEKKDAFEHELVVEDIKARLSEFGEVTLGNQEWIKAGSVEHLKTSISLKSKTKLSAIDVLNRLHPTPAVGVFPRSPEALDWLYGLPESEKRADFAAPWVVTHRDGRAWAMVALRQIRLRDNEIFIPAGCGVVADSVEEVEWKEIQEKINSVKKVWGLPL
jgi:menaquinone-specific isochorismate synthase